MSQQIKFNHVFLTLLAVSALGAFLLPPSFGDRARGKVDNLFIPVSAPVRAMAASLDSRLAGPAAAPVDAQGKARSPGALQDEVDALKFQLANVKFQLEDLKRLNRDLAQLGDLRNSCRLVPVVAGDTGGRQTLSLHSSSLDGLATDMPVVSQYGLVGRLQIVGLAAARVQLITDASFAAQGAFIRYERGEADFTYLKVPTYPVNGDGKAGLRIDDCKVTDLREAGVRPGDWVVLADHAWQDNVQHAKLGEVTEVTESRKNPLFANVQLRPRADLMKLRAVMVVVKK